MKADEIRTVLGSHSDFEYEKSSIERFLVEEKKHNNNVHTTNLVVCTLYVHYMFLMFICKGQDS